MTARLRDGDAGAEAPLYPELKSAPKSGSSDALRSRCDDVEATVSGYSRVPPVSSFEAGSENAMYSPE